jgi:TetR/AcrR family transcriptional regulator
LALRSAEDVFATLGYAGARMEDVAERVGIRRASLMYYFRDKRALYEALLDDLFAGLLEGYDAALAGPEPLKERYLRCIDVWAARIEERPALLRISMWEMAGAMPEGEVPLAARVRPICERLAEAVREGQRQGLFRADVDPIGFVMSVAGTTAFLGLRNVLLNAEVAPPLEPGRLAVELRAWVARVSVRGAVSAVRPAPTAVGSADEERVQLVAVEVAEVAGVEARAARTRRALVLAAERERLRVDLVDLLLARCEQRDHHAVADRGRLLVERLDDGDHRRVRRRRPGDERLHLHGALRAELGEERVVEPAARFRSFVPTVVYPIMAFPPMTKLVLRREGLRAAGR